ncbi:MAG: cytochrome d ubiquinol oxidase subunit II [Solirubrobacterales bacterium]|nr:cytochrome d ubiquinol oxidase subunit II [Solirubrobacterales bacterium]
MELADVPAILILVGIALYAVLAGADFGAPIWAITARGEVAERLKDSGHRSMAPVWEANHVWLIFVLVICWTAYPEVFGSIFSTLWIPLLLACLGIIMRAVGYVAGGVSGRPVIRYLAAVSSFLVPFALGCVIGAIVDGGVPPGNAQGDILEAWTGPVPIAIGLILVASSAYLAAVYLAADAERRGETELAVAFRGRGLAAGVVAGLMAAIGLLALHGDAERVFDGLTSGAGLVAVIASGAAGLVTLGLLWSGRFRKARFVAAIAVAAVVAGWGLAQQPMILPGLTVREAAASDEVIVGLLVAVAIGLIILVPSLALLYSLVLGGRFDPLDVASPGAAPERRELTPAGRRTLSAIWVAALVGGGMLFLSDSGVTLYLGLAIFMASLACGIVQLARSLVRA